ncbi:MAG: hypothetical protein N3E47_06120 [Candidatus Bathyarchaeota archaeon]|nr:hypothetical protein [Candidatus Bathyarchaeota archaeon]
MAVILRAKYTGIPYMSEEKKSGIFAILGEKIGVIEEFIFDK